MAREEQPREDLLAEAKNLVERVSLRLSAVLQTEEEAEIVAGFRRDGSLAIYFGQQRVYQFNSAAALRRAYVDGLLYKAVAGRLVSMRRERTPDAVQLVSVPLSEAESNSFVRVMQSYLISLQSYLIRGQVTVDAQVPEHKDVASRLAAWLEDNRERITIASSPRAS